MTAKPPQRQLAEQAQSTTLGRMLNIQLSPQAWPQALIP